MVTINKTSGIKAIQFIGSPFRGPKAEELKEKNKDSKPRTYVNIADMAKAGMSQEEIIEKVKEVLRKKGILKTNPTKKGKILLIDDDKFILNMYRIKLEKKDIEVETFLDTDGDIVQRVVDVKPDVIGLDIVIPGRNGLEVTKMLKHDERTKNIPVVFMTNQGRQVDIDDATQAGGSGYIILATTTPEQVADYLISFLHKK